MSLACGLGGDIKPRGDFLLVQTLGTGLDDEWPLGELPGTYESRGSGSEDLPRVVGQGQLGDGSASGQDEPPAVAAVPKPFQ